MKDILLRAWRTRGWLACLLWPVAQVHRLMVRLRWILYRHGIFKSVRFDIPIIVVGNVVVGGGGKTPLVMALVRHLQEQGLQVGVVSRGYGRAGRDSLEVTPNTAVEASGDEPALIQRATGAPVFVANKRTVALRNLLAAYPQTAAVVCDDGLQHYALQRDIEIAVFDDKGAGNGWLLPAGPLREAWPGRLGQGIDLVLHTGQKAAFDGYTSRRQLANHALDANGTRLAITSLTHQPLVALAGIANPEGFFDMLRGRGLTLEKTFAFPDHHDFKKADLEPLADRIVLCTEKDAVKLFALSMPSGLQVLAVPLEFSPEPAFLDALDVLLRPLLSQLPSSHGHQTHCIAGLPRDQGSS